MKKLFLLLVSLFMVNVNNAFSYDKSIMDLDKIRWIDSGEDILDFPKIENMKFIFHMPPTVKIYKDYQLKNRQEHGDGEYYDFNKGKYQIEYEFKDGYFLQTIDKNDTYKDLVDYISKNPRRLKSYNVYKGFSRDDGQPIDYKQLEGVYTETETGLKTYITEVKEKDLFGYVWFSDNSNVVDQWGGHFISFNDNAFYSDKSFCEDKNFSSIINDDFSIIILKNTDSEKLLLLDTPRYTRPYVPMEDFFTSETDSVYICVYDFTLLAKNEYPTIHESPDFKSEIIYQFSNNVTQAAKVLERKEEWVEKHDRLSIWIKVHLDKTNIEGWIWGGYVELSDYTSGLDINKVLRYRKYNTVKKSKKNEITDCSNIKTNADSQNTTVTVTIKPLNNKQGTINDDRVRLRESFNLDCKTITFLNAEDAVQIKGCSRFKQEINGESWYWYQVETADNKSGWVYGKYLDIK